MTALHKTVLAVFGERRRPVTFLSSSTAKEQLENLFEAVTVCYSDIVSANEGTSTTNSTFCSKKAVIGD